MEQELFENIVARLCLLTRAAWTEDLPAPMTRLAVKKLMDNHAIESLAVRSDIAVPEKQVLRMQLLLSRCAQIGEMVQSYETHGYDILLPESARWPESLRVLGKEMPLFLFAKGNAALLDGACMGVAGSRAIGEATRRAAWKLGERFAQEKITMVCGGAKGVDENAQDALLSNGGKLIIIPALRASQIMVREINRKALERGDLLLLSETLPDDPFTAYKALSRNHLIYSLGSAALVVAARAGQGGSWRGASDCLKKGWKPVYVYRGAGETPEGVSALCEIGAKPFALSDIRSILSEAKAREAADGK